MLQLPYPAGGAAPRYVLHWLLIKAEIQLFSVATCSITHFSLDFLSFLTPHAPLGFPTITSPQNCFHSESASRETQTKAKRKTLLLQTQSFQNKTSGVLHLLMCLSFSNYLQLWLNIRYIYLSSHQHLYLYISVDIPHNLDTDQNKVSCSSSFSGPHKYFPVPSLHPADLICNRAFGTCHVQWLFQ